MQEQQSEDSFEDSEQQYSYHALIDKQRVSRLQSSDLTEDESVRIQALPSVLTQCFHLRQEIEDHPFGYFFKYPVNPYSLNLPDYWRVIRRPIDLTTIKRKFLLGIYLTNRQFNQDMRLLFNNSLLYNRDKAVLIKQIRELLSFYEGRYKRIQAKLQQGELSDQFVRVEQIRENLASRLSAEELGSIFTEERKQRLGRLLEFLLVRNKNSLLNMLKKIHPDIPVFNKEGKAVYLNSLSPHQLFDLLRLAKNMKSTDFDTFKLMNVAVDPLLQGYNEQHQPVSRHESEQQSDFQIEDESEG